MRSLRLEPVRWASSLLALLIAVETVNEGARLLPASWTPYLLAAIGVLTLLLGSAVRARVTPLAAPMLDEETPLVPRARTGRTTA
jgi:hypothetical protein